jgi:hypothetical protein
MMQKLRTCAASIAKYKTTPAPKLIGLGAGVICYPNIVPQRYRHRGLKKGETAPLAPPHRLGAANLRENRCERAHFRIPLPRAIVQASGHEQAP